MSITDQIKSVRTALGKEHKKPDPAVLDRFKKALYSEDGAEALEYLKVDRNLTEDTIEYFRLGYDTERDAVSIPIFKGEELVNIKYRFLHPDKIKYTQESGAEVWIYHDAGLEVAKQKNGVLIVEGEFDLMSAYQAGIKNVISPASGKDSYGVWLELIDNIPRVYIAYDNDEGGRKTAFQMADRVGVDKSFEVKYPPDIKDANEYFKQYGREDFLELIKKSNPYYSYEFKNIGDVILEMMEESKNPIEMRLLPDVMVENDWLVVVSGETNVGKTGYVLNMAKDLGEQGIASLVLPFERGIVSVGKRFLQILFGKTSQAMQFTTKKEWTKLIDKHIDTPVYFALPRREDIADTIRKSKRFFDTQVIFIDHLDLVVRQTGRNENKEVADTLQELKALAMEMGVVMVVVTHLKKGEKDSNSRPDLKDLKGSSAIYQDPECVVLLSSPGDGLIDVNVAKNKGKQGNYTFEVGQETGVYGDRFNDDF